MVLIGRIFKCSDDQVTVEGCYRIPPLPFPFLHPTEVKMMGFDLMEICSMEVTLFCVFCSQRRLGPCCQSIISEHWQRVSGLRAGSLSSEMPRSGNYPMESLL